MGKMNMLTLTAIAILLLTINIAEKTASHPITWIPRLCAVVLTLAIFIHLIRRD